MIKLLSYLYPITKKIPSKFSGILEITWYNGKKHLNSKNANYSYGSLQKILKFGLDKIDLKKVDAILLLGLGGGSVIETLRRDFKFTKTITAIDIDPVIIDIAKSEFNLKTSETQKIICADALDFMAKTTSDFDLIIIDLFVDVEVPPPFLKLDFWNDVANACAPNGTVLFNASLKNTQREATNKIIGFLNTKFYKTEVYEKVNNTNTLIIAKGL